MDHLQDERFMRLFVSHEPQLLRIVLMYVPRKADAWDVMQEVAIVLWKHFGQYDEDRPFLNWACGFVRIEVRRHLRGAQRAALIQEKAAELLHTAEAAVSEQQENRVAALRRCVERLPADQRLTLQRYYGHEQTVEQLAVAERRTVAAVYKSLQRIRRALLTCIERQLARGLEADPS